MTNDSAKGYLGDILAQPGALRDTLAGFAPVPELEKIAAGAREQRFRQVVMTGMGSSLHVFYPLFYRLANAGLNPVMVETSELIHYARSSLRSDTLVLACSQSGRSAETLRLLELNREQAVVVGITNTPASPLAQQSAVCVLTHAGTETTVSCKTYLAALAAMEWLGDILVNGQPGPDFMDLAALPDLLSTYLSGWRDHVAELKETLRSTRNLFLCGRGPSLAAALTGGLTTKESAHVHAEGMSSAAFRHGPLEMAASGTTVVLFAGQPATLDLHKTLRSDITQAGGQVLWIGQEDTSNALRLPLASPRALPILEMLPVQMMTLALAELQDRVAGEFDRATKVTAKE
jgi:glutamine---fructose-6-phosphate transaminase (isomerizing)